MLWVRAALLLLALAAWLGDAGEACAAESTDDCCETTCSSQLTVGCCVPDSSESLTLPADAGNVPFAGAVERGPTPSVAAALPSGGGAATARAPAPSRLYITHRALLL